MQGAHPSGSVLTPPQPDPQLSKGAMPAFLMNTAAPSWAGLSQADPMDVSGSPLHQDSDMEGVTLGPSSSGLAALPGSLPGAGQSSAWSPQPPAPPIQPLQLPVQVNSINFGLPIPAATAGTSQGLQSPVQSGSFWFGVPSGATSSGGQTVGVAQAAPAAQSPVQVGGFYFGVPSVAGVATDNSAPVRVPQTAPASPLAPPSPSTPAQGLWPQGFASFTPASAVQPGKQQPEQRSDSSSPPPVAPPQGLWPQGFTPLTPASADQPGKQQPEQQLQHQRSSPATPDPVTPPQLIRGVWPQGFTPIIPPSPMPPQPDMSSSSRAQLLIASLGRRLVVAKISVCQAFVRCAQVSAWRLC